jgi:hypothetical protein
MTHTSTLRSLAWEIEPWRLRISIISLIHRHFVPHELIEIASPGNLRGFSIFESPPLADSPDIRGIFGMHALNLKVLAVVVFALAMAIAVHSSVYLSIDAASLTAEMPVDKSPNLLVKAIDRQ